MYWSRRLKRSGNRRGRMNPTVRKWMKLVAWFSFAAIAAVTILPITLRPTFSSSSANIERFFVMTNVGGFFVLAYPRRLLDNLICPSLFCRPT
jgi:hypothetical protein